MGVDTLIFSKDRPAQLDLLLRSIERFAPSLYDTITVLYRAPLYPSDAVNDRHGYRRGYGIVSSRFRGRVTFWGEWEDASFETLTRGWLHNAGPLVSFLVDDDVFYRDAPVSVDVTPLSLRGGDYWYPFSVDGNIYRREDIVSLLAGWSFDNPVTLEAQGHELRHRLPWFKGRVAPPVSQVYAAVRCLTGVPLNRVAYNSSGPGDMRWNTGWMNARFLAGERLIIPPAGDYGAHAEIELEWAEVPSERTGT